VDVQVAAIQVAAIQAEDIRAAVIRAAVAVITKKANGRSAPGAAAVFRSRDDLA